MTAKKEKPGEKVLAKRAELEAFCKDTLKPGRHFGVIHRKSCGTPREQGWEPCQSCGSKPSLYQPGAERICEWRGVLIGEPVLQEELVRVAGGNGWVAFRVTLTDRDSGDVLGHGIGAYKHTDPNIMVKKAKKNAVIEAVRTSFALSDLFDDADGQDGWAPVLDGDTKPAPPLPDHPRAKREQAAPPRAAPPRPPAAPRQGGRQAPAWWKVRAEYPGARCTVSDRDDNEYGVQGAIHFKPEDRPMAGGGTKKWSPFEPNDQGKPDWKAKEPFTEWAQLDWYGLLEWAIKHRLSRNDGDDTNHFNDPFHHLLADKFINVYRNAVMPIAEHAAAMDFIAWGLVQKNGGPVPEWASNALEEARSAAFDAANKTEAKGQPDQAPPATESDDTFALDDEDVPF